MKIPISPRRRLAAALSGLFAMFATALQAAAPVLSPGQLDELLGPIALYPDALVAILLPASTVPADVVMGARYLESGGDVSAVDRQPWDDSVKSLVRYPDVLHWMNENLEWTTAVGEAFLCQPEDVMRSVQGLRLAAKEAGNLKNTPEQVVVVEKEVIRIVPAEPEIIYVPQYDPGVVFVQSYSVAPLITFGVGFAIGSWLNWDCDWRRRCVYRGDWCGWNNGWWNNSPGGWRSGNAVYASDTIINNNINNNTVNVTNIVPQSAQRWEPAARSRQQFQSRIENQTGNARFANNVGRELRSPGSAIADTRNNGRTAGSRPPSLPRPTNLRLTNGQGSNGRNNPSASSPGSASTQRPDPAERLGSAQRPSTQRQLAGREAGSPQVAPPTSTQRQTGFLPTRPPRVDAPANSVGQRPARPSEQQARAQSVDSGSASQRPTLQPTRPPRVTDPRTDVASAVTRPARQTSPSSQPREIQQPTTIRPRTVAPTVQRPEAVRTQRPDVQRPQRPTTQQPRPSTTQPTQQQRPSAVPRPSRQLEAPARNPSTPSVQRPTRTEARPSSPSRQPRQIQQAPATRPAPARPERQQAQPTRVKPVQQLQRPQRSEMSSRPQRPAASQSSTGGPRQAKGRFATEE